MSNSEILKSNYFQKKYFSLRWKLKKILLKAGENDFYPQLRRTKSIFFNDLSRIKFWSYLAKKNQSFKPLYEEKPEEYFLKNPTVKRDNFYFKYLEELYKNGVVEINNFFSKEDHQKILNFFQKNNIKNLGSGSNSRIATSCRDDELNNLIYLKTKEIEKIIFGKTFSAQNYAFETIKKNPKEKSAFATSALWHCDRFIPSFKLIYFATKVTIDPFEYALKSHIINEQYIKNIIVTLNMEKKYAKKMENDVNRFTKENKEINFNVVDKAEKDLCKLNMSGYNPKKFYCNENTLLIVCTHGLHRRSQSTNENETGIRNNITLSFYNKFTRFDLLKKIFN